MKKILKNCLFVLAKIILNDTRMHWFLNKITYFKQHTEGIIIIRNDNIGDYILFRNFLPFIYQSERFQKPLILIGNKAWRDLAEHFDRPYIKHFIWVNGLRYRYNEWYRFFILIKIALFNSNQIINSIHSRTVFINVFIKDVIHFFPFKNKISSIGDAVNLPNNMEKELSDTLFDNLLPSLSNNNFEFFRNKIFVEHLIGKTINLDKPFFEGIKKELKPNQILIFPSAYAQYRRWDTRHFAELIALIHAQFTSLEFLILGSKSDYILGEKIAENLPKSLKIRNLCGQTTLVDLVQIIADSRLLVSNETSAVHIAAAVDTPTICVSNGNHFGRFNPYPASMNCPINYFYPDERFDKVENWKNLIEEYQYKSELNINQIKPESVFSTIFSILMAEN